MKKIILLIICISIFLPLNSYSAELLFHPTWKVGQEFRLCEWSVTYKGYRNKTEKERSNVRNWVENPRAGQTIYLFRIEKIVKIDEKDCYQVYMEKEYYDDPRNKIKCHKY